MKVSVCLSAFNKPIHLNRVLHSITEQRPPFDYEVIVVDDGSKDAVVSDVCSKFPSVQCIRIDRDPVFRNPCVARNVAYRRGRGEFLILQSDDVIHVTNDSINKLVQEIAVHPHSFLIANVMGCSPSGRPWSEYTGLTRRKPFFFLGIIRRSHLYAVGGNDEDFADVLGYDDQWFADCLINGLKLTPIYTTSVIGHHLYHPRSDNDEQAYIAKDFYERKYTDAERSGVWMSSWGNWSEHTNNFDRVFADNVWMGDESKSGTGSSLKATKTIRVEIPTLLEDLSIQTMLDIPCGDYNWMSRVNLRGVSYTGADVSRLVIDHNRVKYPNTEFTVLDIRQDPLPASDLVFCRDCLGHFSLLDCWAAISNIKRSKSKYLLVSNFDKKFNLDKVTDSNWCTRSLCRPPFNFPPPMRLINEHHNQPGFTDKSLGLWRVSEL